MTVDRRIAYAQNLLRSPCPVDRLLGRSGVEPDDLAVDSGPAWGSSPRSWREGPARC